MMYKKPVPRDHIIYDSIHTNTRAKMSLETEGISGGLGLGMGSGNTRSEGKALLFEVIKMS